MIYFKHINIELYSKFNEETGELVNLSVNESDFSISLQVIDASERHLILTQFESTADLIDEASFAAVITPIKARLSQI